MSVVEKDFSSPKNAANNPLSGADLSRALSKIINRDKKCRITF